MFSREAVIRVKGISKRYEIYTNPSDRLKQFILPKLASAFKIKALDYFREFWALKDVSFELRRGDTVGIIGSNGSGKSTLLQIICGTLTPTHGEVEISGRVAALLELGSGFNYEFTGRENAYLNATLLGLTKDQIDDRFNSIVDFSGIGEFIDQPVKSYSSGMIVRLAFSVIAHVDAEILVIDEALAVGDSFFTQKCMRYLRTFMKNGTVIFVTHDTASVNSLCNRAIWIERGQIVAMGPPKRITEDYLEAIMHKEGNMFLSYLDFSSISTPEFNAIEITDERMEYINQSDLRNKISSYGFDSCAPSFGAGGAKIVNVSIQDKNNKVLSCITGGEIVVIKIEAIVLQNLSSPIIGFMIKDRLGQTLFGDNTYISHVNTRLDCKKGANLAATFEFQMPRLPIGNYFLTAAIADGTQSNHTQQHWIHDAIQFKSESTSVTSGLLGIPMIQITLNATN